MRFPVYKYSILSIASLFLLVGCEKEMPVLSVPYTLTVQTDPETRASMSDLASGYVFESEDKLYVKNGDESIYGVLTLDSGANTGTAVFTGSLNATPSAGETMTATLVSQDDKIHTCSGNLITGTTYPSNIIASDYAEAVKKYSNFTANYQYGNNTINLVQQSAFVRFNLHFDGSALTPEDPVTTTINNGGIDIVSSVVPSIANGEASAEFLAVFAGGTVLSSASVTIAGNTFTISDVTLAANTFYSVTRATVLYGGLLPSLPPTSNVTLGSQAFPVTISLDPDAAEKHLLTDVKIVVQTPNSSTFTMDVPLKDILSGTAEADPSVLLTRILSAENNVTYLPSGNYTFSLRTTYDGSPHDTQFATMTVLASNFDSSTYNLINNKPSTWSHSVGVLGNDDYVEVKMTANNGSPALQNIVGFGPVIEGAWGALDGAMFYYPVKVGGTGLRLQGRHVGSDAISSVEKQFDPASRSLVLRFCKQGIFWINADGEDEEFTGLTGDNRNTYISNLVTWCNSGNLKIGSCEGNNRSYATYDYIRVVKYN